MLTGNIPKAPELGTSRYKGQSVGSQCCPLGVRSTVCHVGGQVLCVEVSTDLLAQVIEFISLLSKAPIR